METFVEERGAFWVRHRISYPPLTVDYLEKTSAAGKIPGGYFKREGRPGRRRVRDLVPVENVN